MGDLTKNLSRHEVACNCGCGFDTIDIMTVRFIQYACDYFAEKLEIPKVTLVVVSGCRCLAWNDHEGGADNSQHLYGRALDFYIKEVSVKELWAYFEQHYVGKYGLSLYETFVHFDTRTGDDARW